MGQIALSPLDNEIVQILAFLDLLLDFANDRAEVLVILQMTVVSTKLLHLFAHVEWIVFGNSR